MYKDIWPVILGDKAVAFLIVEPFDGSSFGLTHFPVSLLQVLKGFFDVAFPRGLPCSRHKEIDQPTSQVWLVYWVYDTHFPKQNLLHPTNNNIPSISVRVKCVKKEKARPDRFAF
jgi:hypothetical protein